MPVTIQEVSSSPYVVMMSTGSRSSIEWNCTDLVAKVDGVVYPIIVHSTTGCPLNTTQRAKLIGKAPFDYFIVSPKHVQLSYSFHVTETDPVTFKELKMVIHSHYGIYQNAEDVRSFQKKGHIDKFIQQSIPSEVLPGAGPMCASPSPLQDVKLSSPYEKQEPVNPTMITSPPDQKTVPFNPVIARLKQAFPLQPAEPHVIRFGEFSISVVAKGNGMFSAFGTVSVEAKNKFSAGDKLFNWVVRLGVDMFFLKEPVEADFLVDVLIQFLEPMALGHTA